MELKQCNLGYARCFRLPPERQADAVRFCVERDSADTVRVQYAGELNHLPAEHGVLEFSRAAAQWISPHPDGRTQRQAESFLAAYLNRLARAAGQRP